MPLAAPGAASRSRGSRARSAQVSLISPWPTWKPKLPARPRRPVSRCSAWAPAAVSSFLVRVPADTACWWQCTWVGPDAPRCSGGRRSPGPPPRSPGAGMLHPPQPGIVGYVLGGPVVAAAGLIAPRSVKTATASSAT